MASGSAHAGGLGNRAIEMILAFSLAPFQRGLPCRAPADRSIVAVVERADPHTVIRPATFAAPFATWTAFAVPIMTMPPTGAALARTVASVDPNDIAAQAFG